MLQDKTVLLGVCACTPAYKALDLIGMLKRKGADVKTAVTENGTNMVPVAVLERLSGNPVSVAGQKSLGKERRCTGHRALHREHDRQTRERDL